MDKNNTVRMINDDYDSKEVDKFYHKISREGQMHIGIYTNGKETLEEASKNVIAKMEKRLPAIKKSHKILDIGSGYGETARILAKKYGCRVDCLNLSATQNKRNLQKIEAADLGKLVSVTTGNFEEIPFSRATYDIVWSQDALQYSNKKLKVFREVARVLKPEGRFIFTTPLLSDNCPKEVLSEIYGCLNLKSLGSMKRYKKIANRADLERVIIKTMPDQLVNHYSAVLKKIETNNKKLSKKINQEFLQGTITRIEKWIQAGEQGHVTWGILQFQKRNA